VSFTTSRRTDRDDAKNSFIEVEIATEGEKEMFYLMLSRISFLAVVLIVLSVDVRTDAQTTGFAYQGKLSDAGNPASGIYEMEFRLFDTATVGTGTQIGPTAVAAPVTVSGGIFTVELDLGLAAFSGPPRFLEIGVRPVGSPNPFTILSPRQPLTSAPYSVRSVTSSVADTLSSACVACVSSTQIGSVSGSAVNGQIPVTSVPAGSDSYIQNSTAQQTTSNFNISGTGTANIFNTGSQYNIGGLRVLSVGGVQNVFAGLNAGAANPTGGGNSFFGTSAGLSNTVGDSNAFFGNTSGQQNLTGRANAFFGANAGRSNLANDNAFFGTSAGLNNTSGTGNTFVGRSAGLSNTAESNNTFLGFNSNGAAGITNSTAIGANSVVTTSNTMVLGTNAVTVRVPGNLNIAGSFGANILDAGTQFNIAGTRILSNAGNLNIFVGVSAGIANTTGQNNSFFGPNAGDSNTTGSSNSFFGYKAGQATTTQDQNSFFGVNAGRNNVVSGNSFFGVNAGFNNTTGSSNAFFGLNAGQTNTTGGLNSFFGVSAGLNNTTGNSNSFFGTNAGQQNTTGTNNTFVGLNAGGGNHSGESNAFFGALAGLSNEASKNSFFGYLAGLGNSLGEQNSFFGFQAGKANTDGQFNSFFGSEAGENNTTGVNNSFFGFGSGITNTTGKLNSFFGAGAGFNNTDGDFNTYVGNNSGFVTTASDNSFVGYNAGLENTTGRSNSFFGEHSGRFNTTGGFDTAIGYNASFNQTGLFFATAIGAESRVLENATIALGRTDGSDRVVIYGLGTQGFESLCRNDSNQVASCSSSLRYKNNVHSFLTGLDIVRRLNPITFDWKKGNGRRDIGFAAEDVEKVEPMLTTYNKDGQIEGVKYGQLTTVLVNAVKEQQGEIELLREEIRLQQQQIRALRKQVVRRRHA